MPPKTTLAPRALASRADFVAAQRVAGVNPDPDDVAGVDGFEIEWFERFVDDAWPPVGGRCGRGQHEQPARRDHAYAEGQWLGLTRWTVISLRSTSLRSCAAARRLPETRRLKRRHNGVAPVYRANVFYSTCRSRLERRTAAPRECDAAVFRDSSEILVCHRRSSRRPLTSAVRAFDARRQNRRRQSRRRSNAGPSASLR